MNVFTEIRFYTSPAQQIARRESQKPKLDESKTEKAKPKRTKTR